METISLDDFKKVVIQIGTIRSAEKIEGSDKLLKLQVDFGTEQRQIVSGIARYYVPETVIGKQCPFVVNLAPRMLKGVESQGMILAADNGQPVLMHPDIQVLPGSLIK